jgi:hypothetical protein
VGARSAEGARCERREKRLEGTMAAKSALAAQLDALMGRERNVPVNEVMFLPLSFPPHQPGDPHGVVGNGEQFCWLTFQSLAVESHLASDLLLSPSLSCMFAADICEVLLFSSVPTCLREPSECGFPRHG